MRASYVTKQASRHFHGRIQRRFPRRASAPLSAVLPEGGHLAVMSPGGVLENMMTLVGFEKLFLMLYDELELPGRIFDEVGQRILFYYETTLAYNSLGLMIVEDDWAPILRCFLAQCHGEICVSPAPQIYDTGTCARCASRAALLWTGTLCDKHQRPGHQL